MKSSFYFKLLFFSVIGALAISLISLFFLVRISDIVSDDYRYGYLLYIGRAVEKSTDYRPLSQINMSRYSTPALLSEKDLSLFKLTEFGPESRNAKPNLWLVSEDGKIISSNTLKNLPLDWDLLPHPKKVHGFETNDHFLFEPKSLVLKLDTSPTTFLVSHSERSLFQGPYLWIQGTHTFTTAALALFLALSISFYYLRRKSVEARLVLCKLESGDLKARFEIKRFDEFGNLILDFNRMAQEIERLVNKLKSTELSRANLLQELGHDLRTPLTSLRTTVETLKVHGPRLNEEERLDLFTMMEEDIRYFTDLLEKLMMIASIDEPHYKVTREKVDISVILKQELKSRQTCAGQDLNWKLKIDKHAEKFISGDTHLITRLFKNAFDNASRYATSSILVRIKHLKDKVEVLIIDDGPGLSKIGLEAFGKRREQRQKNRTDETHFSLGLGSVIMKTIAEVHGGHIEIMNCTEQIGATLKVTFNRF